MIIISATVHIMSSVTGSSGTGESESEEINIAIAHSLIPEEHQKRSSQRAVEKQTRESSGTIHH